MAANSTPKPGDVTLCIRCGTALLFDETLDVRLPTEDETAELAADPVIRRLQWLIREIQHFGQRLREAKVQ